MRGSPAERLVAQFHQTYPTLTTEKIMVKMAVALLMMHKKLKAPVYSVRPRARVNQLRAQAKIIEGAYTYTEATPPAQDGVAILRRLRELNTPRQ
jgi:hypothetical protein